jgi:hypothetical protein
MGPSDNRPSTRPQTKCVSPNAQRAYGATDTPCASTVAVAVQRRQKDAHVQMSTTVGLGVAAVAINRLREIGSKLPLMARQQKVRTRAVAQLWPEDRTR